MTTRRLLSAACIAGLLLVAGCGGTSDASATGSHGPATADADAASADTASGNVEDTTPAPDGAAIGAEATARPEATAGVGTEAEPGVGGTPPIEPAEQQRPTAVVVVAGGLTPEFADVIESLPGTAEMTVVQIARVHLIESSDSSGGTVDDPPDGFVIQLDARIYEDLRSARAFAPELVEAIGGLGPDQVVLSASSAALRRLDRGSTMIVEGGATLEVGLILPDELVGATEVVLGGSEAISSITDGATRPRRVALVDYGGTGEELERELLAAAGGQGVRVFGGAGADDQQDRDRAVLAQLRIKEIFGEFAFKRGAGGAVQIDPAWIEANIVTIDLPLLGPAKCHRLYGPILDGVLQGLIDDGLSEVIDPSAFQGCWNPRFIAGSDRLSRHAWGIAADINFSNALDGEPGSPVHPELLERMAAVGITSGHNWSTPDPGHFEFLRQAE